MDFICFFDQLGEGQFENHIIYFTSSLDNPSAIIEAQGDLFSCFQRISKYYREWPGPDSANFGALCNSNKGDKLFFEIGQCRPGGQLTVIKNMFKSTIFRFIFMFLIYIFSICSLIIWHNCKDLSAYSKVQNQSKQQCLSMILFYKK